MITGQTGCVGTIKEKGHRRVDPVGKEGPLTFDLWTVRKEENDLGQRGGSPSPCDRVKPGG